ncbi:helix-turn-helix domain-containing protein [Lichenibacterium minor]|uniref:Helix-turn-helix domain-containing protein n=1 Tax=Lichenibacterium minor TaxID=2316528 RepID=A0A4Q2U1G9_9HYPH|nr:helix-turn-helix domain-containing protein [Lichenibacterium minor]RYC29538.1 helix-turn-helix domain-containing protein [Lichenibacterium minor]
MKTRAEMLARLPAVRREAIEKEARELILKEKVLRRLRTDQGLSQKAVAETMGIGQDCVSRLERRGDCLVSTMRDYVEAVGGHLRLVADFPGVGLVEIVAEDMRSLVQQERPTASNCNSAEADHLQLAHC